MLLPPPTPDTTSPVNHAEAISSAATLTFASPGPGLSRVVQGIIFGYSDTPATPGRLVARVAGEIVLAAPVTTSGAGFLPVTLKAGTGQALTITLESGGTGVTAEVNVGASWTE